MSPLEALRSLHFQCRIYAGFDEEIKGSIAVGKLADLTVFSKDLMTVPEDDIPSARVLFTIVGGATQYAAEGATSPAARR